MGDRRWTDVVGLADRVREPVLDAAGRPVDPVLVVDLDGPPSDVDAAAQAARSADRVLIGLATSAPAERLRPLFDALDVTVVPRGQASAPQLVAPLDPLGDPVAEVAGLVAAVEAHPQAATALAGLLRWSTPLDVPAALDAESFVYSTLLGGAEFRSWLAARGPRPLPPSVADPVLLARVDATLRITLNRPERRNAYGRQLRDALVDALALAELDPGIAAVVIDGAGPAFCAGGDLDEFGTTPDPVVAHLVRTRAGAARPLHRLAARTEVRVHGACVGAGIELPAFAARIVADPATTFRLPEVGMGLIPGAGGTVSIPRRIGRWRTCALALSGAALAVGPALEWGLIDEVR